VGKKSEKRNVVVVIDDRERTPYAFPDAVTARLKTGDYSAQGFEQRVAIERKSLVDAYGSIGGGRNRFEREVQRLAELEYGAIVIEATLAGFLEEPPAYSDMNPRSALLSYLAWSVKYRVPVFFAGDRRHGNAVTWHLLRFFAMYQERARK
jgi:ERCC4-type nuclease